MKVFVSTNSFIKSDFSDVFKVLEAVRNDKEYIEGTVGIEIFPDIHNENFNRVLEDSMDEIRKYPVTLHGPYFGVEHSAPGGSEEFRKSMEDFERVLEIGKMTNAEHIVFHHNNRVITPEIKAEIIDNSEENLKKVNNMAEKTGIPLLIENAGVDIIGNNLFSEDEFIKMSLSSPLYILIDIGHAHANGWNIERVMSELKDKIKAYHLHNNDGKRDLHDRIFNGTLDFTNFMKLYRKYTPDADLVIEYGYHLSDSLKETAEDVLTVLKYAKS